MHWTVTLGQMLIGAVYLIAVINDLYDREFLLSHLASRNDTYHQYLFIGGIGLKIVCGLALLFNVLVPAAAFILAGFTLIANVIFNDFWRVTPVERKSTFLHFLINMAVIGGLLILAGA